MPRAESIVLLNTGHGKGKSSAAFGVMSRGWARGWRVGVVQFVKGGKWKTFFHLPRYLLISCEQMQKSLAQGK